MRTLLFLAITCSLLSCKNISPEQKTLDVALEAYIASPTDLTSKAYSAAFRAFTDAKGYDHPSTPSYILEGARLAESRKQLNAALSWYQSYITKYPAHPDLPDHLIKMRSLMEAFEKPELSQVYYRSLVNRLPDHPSAETIAANIVDPQISVESLLNRVAGQMYNKESGVLDLELTQLYIEMTEVSVMTDPGFAQGPDHLLRAGEIARTLKLYSRALKDLNWIIHFYPDHPHASSGLYLKGLIYYTDLKDFEKAGSHFKEYLEKDPYGPYEYSATALLDSISRAKVKLLPATQEEAD